MDFLGQFGSNLASIWVIWAMIERFFPHQSQSFIHRFSSKLANFLFPYVEISFFEYSEVNNWGVSEAFSVIEHYLSSISSKQARKLKGDFVRQNIELKMDEYQEVRDKFEGINVVWSLGKIEPSRNTVSYHAAGDKRYYSLTFHSRHRNIVTETYLKHVMIQGKNITQMKRQRKLYTNCIGEGVWNQVIFEHPASFEILAMDPQEKKEIVDDLITFSKAKEYYARIGKPWKRGYLLYGPPGTGKSTLVAAIANFLNYDIFDIELTAVKTNSELRKLLMGIRAKSVVVIEDIDCSLDLSGQRKTNSEGSKPEQGKNQVSSFFEQVEGKARKSENDSKVTLSGLLNFIDGIWSASTGERLIIFTTNHVEKLDKALIRRGRMDKHIQMSYCGFEAFKVLAKNYLSVESHQLFDAIRGLLEEINMTPADVAENLMPKASDEDVGTSLERLIQELTRSKEEALMKNAKKEGTAENENQNENENEVSQGFIRRFYKQRVNLWCSILTSIGSLSLIIFCYSYFF